jgi:hypothetical protein
MEGGVPYPAELLPVLPLVEVREGLAQGSLDPMLLPMPMLTRASQMTHPTAICTSTAAEVCLRVRAEACAGAHAPADRLPLPRGRQLATGGGCSGSNATSAQPAPGVEARLPVSAAAGDAALRGAVVRDVPWCPSLPGHAPVAGRRAMLVAPTAAVAPSE